MDYGWLNIGSLILGLIAWILPVINLMRYNQHINKNWFIFSIVSISACAISLCIQIFYTNHLVNIQDWTALMDTLNTVTSTSILLLVVTIILNLITFITYYRKK